MADTKLAKREEPKRAKCDNHPDRDAVLVTDGKGAHNEIHLCDECTPDSLRDK